MRIIPLILAALFAATALPPQARAAQPASVQAILITASNNKVPADPRLAPYEATLQRNLPESSFRFVAQGSTSVSTGGHARIPLAGGHRVELEGEKQSKDGIKLKIQWLNGRSPVMGGEFTLHPGVPVVLGRRPSGDGDVPIVIVIAK
jgi:hypothetical protein